MLANSFDAESNQTLNEKLSGNYLVLSTSHDIVGSQLSTGMVMVKYVERGVGIRDATLFIGVVENNDDPQLEGRVKVRAFSVHGNNRQIPTQDLPWAVVASGSYDLSQPPPPLNSFVYGMFLDGRDAQTPLVLGLIPGQYLKDGLDPEKNGLGCYTSSQWR